MTHNRLTYIEDVLKLAEKRGGEVQMKDDLGRVWQIRQVERKYGTYNRNDSNIPMGTNKEG